MRDKSWIYIALVASALLFNRGALRADENLYVDPVAQRTEVWCWAAVSEMLLTHYDYGSINPFGDFQCGVVAMLGGICNANCGACRTGIGSLHNLKAVLEQYQAIAEHMGVAGDAIRPRVRGALSTAQIIEEIDEGDPIIAGISPSGMGGYYPPSFGEHVALIVGYEENDGRLYLIVNDPFPYAYTGFDPFLMVGAEMLEPGQYLISYDSFRRRLSYKDSIYFR